MKKFKNTWSLAVAALGLAISAPAFASGPLNLNSNDPDGVERWPAGGANIPYNPDQNGLAGVMDAVTVSAAFAEWQSIATATGTYSNNGTLAADIIVANFCSPPPFNPSPPIVGPGCHLIGNLFFGLNVSDGLSPIVFDDDGSIFLTLFGEVGQDKPQQGGSDGWNRHFADQHDTDPHEPHDVYPLDGRRKEPPPRG